MKELKISNQEITIGKEIENDYEKELYLACIDRRDVRTIRKFINNVNNIIADMQEQYEKAEMYLKAYQDIYTSELKENFQSMRNIPVNYYEYMDTTDPSNIAYNPWSVNVFGNKPAYFKDEYYKQMPYAGVYNNVMNHKQPLHAGMYDYAMNQKPKGGIELASLKCNFEWDDDASNIISNLETKFNEAHNEIKRLKSIHRKVDNLLSISNSADEFVQRIKEQIPELIGE